MTMPRASKKDNSPLAQNSDAIRADGAGKSSTEDQESSTNKHMHHQTSLYAVDKPSKSRLSNRKQAASNILKTRARKIKAHETVPFLAIDTTTDYQTYSWSDVWATDTGKNGPRRLSPSQVSPSMGNWPQQMSRFSMYSSPSIPTRHTLTRGSSPRKGTSSAVSQRSMTGTDKSGSTNQHIKMPFKHSVHAPSTPAPVERPTTPSQNMKERTALATYHMNKMLALDKQIKQAKPKGKLLKARLKPLYPVRMQGPSIKHCRGILADAHKYSSSASRTLQRQRQIMSNMEAGELATMMYRPRTVESIHQTSAASSVDENLLEASMRGDSDGSVASSSVTSGLPEAGPSDTSLNKGTEDIALISEPAEFASASPIVSRKASQETLRGSSQGSERDTSTVFLTSGKSVEMITQANQLQEMESDLEVVSQEVIEITDMLKKRISLIGFETEQQPKLDEPVQETNSNNTKDKPVPEVSNTQNIEETDIGSADVRVRPYSASANLSTQGQSPGKIDPRPLSTGDVSRRKPLSGKSVRFADQTDSPRISEAWKDEDNIISSADDNTNNSAKTSKKHVMSNRSKSRCKPMESDTTNRRPHQDDDDKENHVPKPLFFSSSETFAQTLATAETHNPPSSKDHSNNAQEHSEPVSPLSFIQGLLEESAPPDVPISAPQSNEEVSQTDETLPESVKPFPLISLSERIAFAKFSGKSSEEPCDHNSPEHNGNPDHDEEAEEVAIKSDRTVDMSFTIHNVVLPSEDPCDSGGQFQDKPPVCKTQKKKNIVKGSARKSNSSHKLFSRNRPVSPTRTSQTDRSHAAEKKKISQLKYSSNLYSLESKNYFPSDLIHDVSQSDGKKAEGNVLSKQAEKRRLRSSPSIGQDNNQSNSNSKSKPSNKNVRTKLKIPHLALDAEDDAEKELENLEIFTYDDLDIQIDLIQQELKKNISQQEQLISETEDLRKSLRSREGFYSDRVSGSEPGTPSITLQSDNYYQNLLDSYRKKCMEMGENCLMISDFITTPRWQTEVADHSESMHQTLTVNVPVPTGQDSVPLESKGDNLDDNVPPDLDSDREPDIFESELTNEKSPSFLKLLCTTVEQVEKPLETFSPKKENLKSSKQNLEVIATQKELTKKAALIGKPSAPFPPLCFSINARPPKGWLYYFSYGFDMSLDRMSLYLQKEVKQQFWALLMGFSLVFNKKGEDTEAWGFPNLELNPFCSVEGCIYQLTPSDLNLLDTRFGVPQHYCRVVLPVWMCNSLDPDSMGVAQYCVPAVMYMAQDQWVDKDSSLSTDYSVSQCLKSSKILTPGYRSHLEKMLTSTPQVQAVA